MSVGLPGELPDHVTIGVVPLRTVRLIDDEQPQIAGGKDAAAEVVRHHLDKGEAAGSNFIFASIISTG